MAMKVVGTEVRVKDMTKEELRAYRRERDARSTRRAVGMPAWPCPECEQLKWTKETLQAHRYIAHGVLEKDAF